MTSIKFVWSYDIDLIMAISALIDSISDNPMSAGILALAAMVAKFVAAGQPEFSVICDRAWQWALGLANNDRAIRSVK